MDEHFNKETFLEFLGDQCLEASSSRIFGSLKVACQPIACIRYFPYNDGSVWEVHESWWGSRNTLHSQFSIILSWFLLQRNQMIIWHSATHIYQPASRRCSLSRPNHSPSQDVKLGKAHGVQSLDDHCLTCLTLPPFWSCFSEKMGLSPIVVIFSNTTSFSNYKRMMGERVIQAMSPKIATLGRHESSNSGDVYVYVGCCFDDGVFFFASTVTERILHENYQTCSMALVPVTLAWTGES